MGAQGSRNVESGNEWSTPPSVVEHAARVLGIPAFDLDPAATAGNAKATAFYTRKDNGLMRDWFGFVWLNPPFSRSLSLSALRNASGPGASSAGGTSWRTNMARWTSRTRRCAS